MPVRVSPISAFRDNYIWLISESSKNRCIIVDPGQAEPVLKTLLRYQLTLEAILVTHYHWDHTNGIKNLIKCFPVPVYGPRSEPVVGMTHPVQGGDIVRLVEGSVQFQVIDTPGHTQGHIVYYGQNLLFSGDTLFTGGCGRLFEGDANQMYTSLGKLADLPDDTFVYCGHEYTLANLRFAQFLEPNNLAIKQRVEKMRQLRQQSQPTVPSLLSEERLTNPFLRCNVSEFVETVSQRVKTALSPGAEVFSLIRRWKNAF